MRRVIGEEDQQLLCYAMLCVPEGSAVAGLAGWVFQKNGKRERKKYSLSLFFLISKLLKNRQPSQPSQPMPAAWPADDAYTRHKITIMTFNTVF